MDAQIKSGQGLGHPDHSSSNQFSPLHSSTETHESDIDFEVVIAHLKAVGFKPGEKIWMRLWVNKNTPIELAKQLGLAYQDKKTGQWKLSTVNGYLTLGENGQATFTKYFGKKPKTYAQGWQQLKTWNLQGFNIGFLPNPGGRKDQDITECRCLFYEVDDKPFEEQRASL